jgi:hypothetical protein
MMNGRTQVRAEAPHPPAPTRAHARLPVRPKLGAIPPARGPAVPDFAKLPFVR